MIRYSYISILICTLLFSCKSQKQEMEIRYTSLNDYDANYVFNLKNNTTGLKKTHQFTLAEIEAQKHFVDSLKNSSYMDSLPQTYKDHQYGTSLSLTASDVYLYTPPNEFSFDQVSDEDLVMVYELNEEQFTIKNIVIGERYKENTISIKEKMNTNFCELKVDDNNFRLETLYQVFEKIQKLQYHLQKDLFTYQVFDSKNNHVLDITFKDKGTSLLLNYI
ncbi:hypothetical protein J8L88_16465 [Aquimarina sp. MMG015]|uniref:hypothetical protein n=1 Tax=Aquimarina sp. MMG015 TaxID=2822689 RepID=UPI001B39DD64|nr:hypothetical protein [Aquimarina sp. MMG015]MBQ4804456.1 hypothetical protein [Aquimarina sp. MMG015]